MAGSTFPTELLAGIFDHLPPSSLAAVSRVCHTWKTLAFGPLYQTVYLCLAAHLHQFVQRIRMEDEDSQFSILAHLKGLVLDIEYYEKREAEMIGESDLDDLNAAIPRLTQLEHLSWNLLFVPRDSETFRLFQTQCPKLDSVHIWICDRIDFYSERYDMLLDFKNLSCFSLSIRHKRKHTVCIPAFQELNALLWVVKLKAPSFNEDQLEPLISLLARCPRLSSLILDIPGEFTYSPADLVVGLGDQFVFPHLRRLYARGSEDPNWMDFFENPNSNPFRQFLRRHPGIEDLALGYYEETPYCKEIDPTEIAQLFPSLKYFEGPIFLFQPLVLSTLAGQLEKLIIVDDPLFDEVSLSRTYDRVPALPKLRRFGIWGDYIQEEGMLIKLLRSIVNSAGQLEEIEIRSDIDSADCEEVMRLFAQVRCLRSVTLSEAVLSLASKDDGGELEWEAFALNLRRTCPKVRRVYRSIDPFGGENREKVWELLD